MLDSVANLKRACTLSKSKGTSLCEALPSSKPPSVVGKKFHPFNTSQMLLE